VTQTPTSAETDQAVPELLEKISDCEEQSDASPLAAWRSWEELPASHDQFC
jgi:hypothetical protein